MRVLLDECVPKQLRRELQGQDVLTVPQMGWAGVSNGALLHRAASEFDVLITSDQSIEHQQNVPKMDLAIIVLVAESNDVEVLRPLMPEVCKALARAQPGTVRYIGTR